MKYEKQVCTMSSSTDTGAASGDGMPSGVPNKEEDGKKEATKHTYKTGQDRASSGSNNTGQRQKKPREGEKQKQPPLSEQKQSASPGQKQPQPGQKQQQPGQKQQQSGEKKPSQQEDKQAGAQNAILKQQNMQKKGQGQGEGFASGQAQADGVQPTKSKAELRAERRLKQEAQRAAKSQKKSEASTAPASKSDSLRVPAKVLGDDPATQKREAKKLEKQNVPQRLSVKRKDPHFSHLRQYERELKLPACGTLHPDILRLGLEYFEGFLQGSNARALGLLAAFHEVILSYSTPQNKDLSRDLEARIKPYISFLDICRPLSVSMGNAIKFIKWQIAHVAHDVSDKEAKERLISQIDEYVRKIDLASSAIVNCSKSKLTDGDVVIVYGCSSLIYRILCSARKSVNFRVIVVDGRPRCEGKKMIQHMVKEGIKCSYTTISNVNYVMQEATKVLLGAHALMANGCVKSRSGTSLVIMEANANNVPVLVCCETYKFCEKSQADAFVFNELGDPDSLVKVGNRKSVLAQCQDNTNLFLVNLAYDVTPPELVSVVITELGMIPCTSVPVVLRKQAFSET
ncbi:translation initiation factor eIF-2B subunit delta-like isoform X3 [Pomacea canaliculata]|uniref:translation initiation factor eIF-2B subunit delta-like isoform X3 n=1 Tax=Pomacea canaliculata TaxID=400727 RepID=UPI000D73556C|nr:translation initiation factor eIF-2B subunit delta-like isoform X3 [Pomacea canaliculata]